MDNANRHNQNIYNANVILPLNGGRENPTKKSTQWSEALIVWVPFWRYTSVKVKSLGSAEEEADEIQSNALQRSD